MPKIKSWPFFALIIKKFQIVHRTLNGRLFLKCMLTFGMLASHAGVFRGARISSLPTNACSTEDNIPFPRLANHVVLSKFWKVDLTAG